MVKQESQPTQTQMEFTQLTQPGLTPPDECSNMTPINSSSHSPLSPPPIIPYGRLVPCVPSAELTAIDLLPTQESYWLGRSHKCDLTANYSSTTDDKLSEKENRDFLNETLRDFFGLMEPASDQTEYAPTTISRLFKKLNSLDLGGPLKTSSNKSLAAPCTDTSTHVLSLEEQAELQEEAALTGAERSAALRSQLRPPLSRPTSLFQANCEAALRKMLLAEPRLTLICLSEV